MLIQQPATLQAKQQLATLDQEASRLQQELRTGFAATDAIVRFARKPSDPGSAPSCRHMRQLHVQVLRESDSPPERA